jgi:hypothetical protein
MSELPVGGSTGLSHEHTASIEVAARYLAETPPIARPSPLVPAMREMFGLTSIEVCAAIRESHQIRMGGGSNATS